MIKTFKDKRTRELFDGLRVHRQWRQIAPRALAKLQILNAAETIQDLYNPPSNRLESLGGDRSCTYSIRVSDRWRLCFQYDAGNAYDVEIIDYH